MRHCWASPACLVVVATLALPATARAQLVIGPGTSGTTPIQFIEPSGTRTVDAFPGFLGGARVTLGDVNGDGVADIIAGAGPGGGPHVRVFSGTDLSELFSFFAFDPAFAGGVYVAAGDINGDGRADIILGAGPGGGPHVRVLSGADLSELASFWAYDPTFGGGVRVAAGDVNGDGRADIITGAGAGGGPHVRVLSGLDLSELASFFAYDPRFPGGVFVAAGDLNGDGLSDIVTGAGPGGGPHVRVLSGADLSELASLWAFDPAFGGGVVVATGDMDGDGRVDLILGALDPHVRILSGVDLSELASFFTPPGMGAGISVGSTGDPMGLRFTSPTATSFLAATAGTFTVTTAGTPVPALTSTGTLPTGVTFVDNGDGTATLAGTPGAGTSGEHSLTFTATNGVGTPVTQSFTLTVTDAPAITSAPATTFNVGLAGSFTVTTTGFPLPAIGESGASLPAGISFVDNGDGTGTLSGTAASGTGGSYALAFTANNGIGAPAVQAFTLTVSDGPAITSATTTTFTVGSLGTFTVTAVGTPTPAISAGALPAGVTFVDNGNGTGTLSGTPGAGTGGVHAITFTATNGILPNGSQAFTLTVNEAPAITSAAGATFTTGVAGSFTVTTTGFPAPALARGGVALPAGMAFVDNGNGTGTLTGTPALGTGGVYPIQFTATNVAGATAPQAFTLTVNGAPAFTSAAATTFVLAVAGSFTVTAVGTPTPTLSVGALPGGVTFVDNLDGTGTLGGTPAGGTAGPHTLTFSATNGVGGPVTQTFTLTITEGPVITSASSATFALGALNTFTVTASGFPFPSLVQAGAALPSGVTWVDNGDGTGTLSGTPAAGTGGDYALTFTATNGSGSAVQNFTLTVSGSPGFTSTPTTTFTVGTPGTFTVTAIGAPAPAITVSGTLPSGVTFLDNGGGGGTLSGTPGAGTGGTYALTFTAANGVLPDGTQAFTLNVNEGPAITSANATTFTVGSAGSFNVAMTGFPTPTVSVTAGTLPAGVTLTPAGLLSGTPDTGTGGTYNVTLTATNGIGANAVQAFTLTINEPPIITSVNTATFVLNTAGTTFQVVMTGIPAPTVSVTSGVLPTGLTLSAAGLLSGTPTQSGSFPVTLTATNGTLPNATQAFTVLVNAAPAITSAAATTFTVGSAGSFNVVMTGFPAPTVSVTAGTLPAGVTLSATGLLSGTPDPGTGGTYNVTLTATNGIGADAVQAFTLTVNQAPAITSANTAAFLLNTAGTTFQVVMTGFPAPTVSVTTGTLPTGLTLSSAGLLSGTPTQGGSFPVTLTATNGTLPNATQAFTVAVNAPPAITSANNTTFTVGTPGTFTVTTTGFPAPTASQTGTLPTGVTFTPATKVLAGTATQTGAFPLVITATNAVPPDATQNFTLNVVCPAITVNPSTLPDGLFNTAYGPVTFSQTGSTGSSFTWSAPGLPTGIAIAPTTGIVSGTPTTTVVNGPVAITVTDNFGCTGTRNTTITIRPVAGADAFGNGVGNTQLAVGAVGSLPTTPTAVLSGNVKTNDDGVGAPGALTVVLAAASTNGGTIAEGATDGSFLYTPAANFAGASDSFTYTLTDGNLVTNTATVTINLLNRVWYVNGAAAVNGDGRSNSPFNNLNNAQTPSLAGDIVYVHTGGASTPGSLAMDANSTLQGAGGAVSLNAGALVIPAGTPPTLAGTVTLADNDAIRNVNFSGAAPAITASGVAFTSASTIDQVTVTGGTSALSLTNVTATGAGAITVSNSSFTNTSAAEVLISLGNVPITFANTVTISSNAGRSIDIQDRTGGTIAFNGPITDTGQGIFLDSNASTTINFTGGLALATTSFPAFTATNGGTVNVCDENPCNPAATGTLVNTITTTTGTALNVANTTIGANRLEFRSISANGAVNGIVLSNTGATAGLTVTGNGGTCTNANTSGCTGGEIRNTTGVDDSGTTPVGTGIVLNNTTAPSLTRMWIHDHSNFAIRGTNVQGFTMANTVINGINGNNDGFDEGAVSFTNLTGSASVTNSSIGGAIEHNMQVLNSSGTLNRLTVSGTTFGAMDTTFGSDGLLIESSGTAVMNVTVDTNTFTSARGDHFQYSNTTAAQAGDVVFTNNTITNAHPAVVGGGGGIRVVGGNNTGQNGSINFNVSGNTIQGARGTTLAVNKLGGTGTYSGTIANNVVGVTGVSGSGSLEGSGIFVLSDGGGTYTASITGNTVRQFDNDGIFMQTGGSGVIGTGAMNVTVTGNTVTEPEPQVGGALATNGFHLNGGTTVGDTYQICLNLSGNTLAGSGQDTIPAGSTFGDFRLRQRQSTTVRLPGYAGGATDTAAAVTFIQGQNPGGESGVAATNSPPGGGFVGGAACPTP